MTSGLNSSLTSLKYVFLVIYFELLKLFENPNINKQTINEPAYTFVLYAANKYAILGFGKLNGSH